MPFAQRSTPRQNLHAANPLESPFIRITPLKALFAKISAFLRGEGCYVRDFTRILGKPEAIPRPLPDDECHYWRVVKAVRRTRQPDHDLAIGICFNGNTALVLRMQVRCVDLTERPDLQHLCGDWWFLTAASGLRLQTKSLRSWPWYEDNHHTMWRLYKIVGSFKLIVIAKEERRTCCYLCL